MASYAVVLPSWKIFIILFYSGMCSAVWCVSHYVIDHLLHTIGMYCHICNIAIPSIESIHWVSDLDVLLSYLLHLCGQLRAPTAWMSFWSYRDLFWWLLELDSAFRVKRRFNKTRIIFMSGAAEGLGKWYGGRDQISWNKVTSRWTKCNKRIIHNKNWQYTKNTDSTMT